MGKKNQEMSQVYNSSNKNEFIFNENGGRGKHLSSFLKNLSLTGTTNASKSKKAQSYQDINSNIYGSLSYNKADTSNGSASRTGSPNLRTVSMGGTPVGGGSVIDTDLRSVSYHNNHSAPSLKSNRRASSNSIRYADLDDDWDAGLEEVAKSKPNKALNRIPSNYESNSSRSSFQVISSGLDPFYPDLAFPTKVSSNTSSSPTRKSHMKESLDLEDAQAKIEVSKLNQSYARFTKFKKILNGDEANINIQDLRKLSWNGIPNELRAMSWQILLGYLPTNKSRQSSTLLRKRQEYLDGIKSISFDFDDNTNNSSSVSVNGEVNSNREKQLYHQVNIDVKRTNPTIKFYSYATTQTSLRKILYLWAIRHPASGYVQGINDLVTPFFQIFVMHYIWQLQNKKLQVEEDYALFIPGMLDNEDEVEKLLLQDANLPNYTLDNFDPSKLSPRVLGIIESDTYWCFSRLLETITDNYIHQQPGIIRQVSDLKNLISKIDVELLNHFELEGIEFIQFSFRWMNCLLMRELSTPLIIRMWDTYLSENPLGFNIFHVYVCAAFLIKFSLELKTKDFQEIILFLQNPPTQNWTEKDIELMLSEAFIWQSLYKNASAHLR